jgi:ankyrin repeat protein
MVKFLLDRGASLAARDNDGFTPLHGAADHGHAELVEFFLARGLDVNLRSTTQYTPLHCAANAAFTNEIHYVAVVQLLLDHGADLDARERYNLTPLHFAAVMGRPQIIKILLAAKADPQVPDISGKTALDWAIARQHSDCVELLRSARQVHTPDAKVQKSSQSPNPPAGEPKP